jgi:hypothetical protein
MTATFPAYEPPPVDELLEELVITDDARRLEVIADALCSRDDRRAVPALLRRLSCRLVQRNEFVEDALCGALVSFGVMRRTRTGRYVLHHPHELDMEILEVIRALDPDIPLRYFLLARAGDGAAGALPREPVEPCRHGKLGECPYCREHS